MIEDRLAYATAVALGPITTDSQHGLGHDTFESYEEPFDSDEEDLIHRACAMLTAEYGLERGPRCEEDLWCGYAKAY